MRSRFPRLIAAVVLLALVGRPGLAQGPQDAPGATEGPEASDAQPPKPELPIHEREPFDRIVLDEHNDNAELLVEPLPFPDRQVPEDPPPRDRLKFKPLDKPGEEFDVPWHSIERIDLFEQMVLAEARRLTADGQLRQAYDMLAMLDREYPELPGLNEAFAEFLYEEAKQAFRAANFDLALLRLREAHQRWPEHPGLPKALSVATEKVAERYAEQDDYASARALIENLAAWYPEDPTAQAWERRLSGGAQQSLAAAKEAARANDWAEAARQVRLARQRWPALPGLAAVAEQVERRYPRVVIGTAGLRRSGGWATGLAHPATPWTLRRTDRLLWRRYAEVVGPASDGARYTFPVGPIETADFGQRLLFRRAATDDTAVPGVEQIAGQWLAMTRPGPPPGLPMWRELLDVPEKPIPVDVTGPDVLEATLGRVCLRPQRLIGTAPQPPESSRPLATGPYTLADVAEGQHVYRARAGYFAAASGQPHEVVEREVDPRRALDALAGGEVDVIDRVPSWLIERFEQAATRGDIRLRQYAFPLIACLVPNPDSPLVQNHSFRRGLLFGLDRKGVLRRIHGDQMPDGAAVLATPMPVGTTRQTDANPHRFDPRLAIALINLARKEMAKGDEVKDDRGQDGAGEGEEGGGEGNGEAENDEAEKDEAEKDEAEKDAPSRVVLGYAAEPMAEVTCRTLAEQWKRLGIEVELREVADPLGAVRGGSGEVDLVYVELSMPEPVIDLVTLYGGRSPRSPGADAAPAIPHANPYIRLAARRLCEAVDWSQAADALAELHDVLHAQLPVLPLWQITPHFAHRPGLDGLGAPAVSIYQEIERWRPASVETENTEAAQ